MSVAFVSKTEWSVVRPHVLVVACSDGRYQICLDEFLQGHLSIFNYDRLYAPGGPGSMASTFEFFRGDQFRKEAGFLIGAHQLEEIILIFHGTAAGGPAEAACADYKQKLPFSTDEEIHRQQLQDLVEVIRAIRKVSDNLRLSAYRAEVVADKRVQFVQLPLPVLQY